MMKTMYNRFRQWIRRWWQPTTTRAVPSVSSGQLPVGGVKLTHLHTEVLTAFAAAATVGTATLAASSTIPSTYSLIRVMGFGGAVTLTSTPTIAAGTTDGQLLWIFGASDTHLVTLQDDSSLPGSTLHLMHARNMTLGLNDNLSLVWDATQAGWIANTPPVETY